MRQKEANYHKEGTAATRGHGSEGRGFESWYRQGDFFISKSRLNTILILLFAFFVVFHVWDVKIALNFCITCERCNLWSIKLVPGVRTRDRKIAFKKSLKTYQIYEFLPNIWKSRKTEVLRRLVVSFSKNFVKLFLYQNNLHKMTSVVWRKSASLSIFNTETKLDTQWVRPSRNSFQFAWLCGSAFFIKVNVVPLAVGSISMILMSNKISLSYLNGFTTTTYIVFWLQLVVLSW